METATAPFNLFATAKKVETKTATKDKEKVFVPGLEPDLLEYAKCKVAEANAKTRKEMIGGRIKEVGRNVWLKKLATSKCRPDSFQLCDGAGMAMLIVMDAYKKVEPAKESELAAYPDVLETSTVFTINPEIFAKEGVGQALSDAIMNSTGISDEDKVLLIQKSEVTSVKKGTIDRLLTFKNYEQLFYLIEPTVALK